MLEKTYDNQIIVSPNTEKRIIVDFTTANIVYTNTGKAKTFGVFVRYFLFIYKSYRCKGYTGINCQFECFGENDKFECDYHTGVKFCKDKQFNNPPDCNARDIFVNIVNKACTGDICKNGGKCTLVYIF